MKSYPEQFVDTVLECSKPCSNESNFNAAEATIKGSCSPGKERDYDYDDASTTHSSPKAEMMMDIGGAS